RGLGLRAAFAAARAVGVGGRAGVVGVARLGATGPCWRAGRMSAVAAITMGTAPAVGRGSRAEPLLAGLPLPRPITLGITEALARPGRSPMTMGAILVGGGATIFAPGLPLSLPQVAQDLVRDPH